MLGWLTKVISWLADEAAHYENMVVLGDFNIAPEDRVFSWWDYRMIAFRRKIGLRIDLVLASQRMAKHCTASYVDIVPRRQERPSDHAPVIAEIADKSCTL